MPVRNRSNETFAAQAAPVAPRHVGRRPGFVDEHQVLGTQPWLIGTPRFARCRDVRPVLLGGVERLFLSVIARASRKRHTDERPTWTPSRANSARSSGSVRSGCSF